MNIDKLHEFLRDTGSISVNKKLAKGIGLHEAIFYSELASKYKYFKDRGQLSEGGYFYNTIENMKEDTTLSKYQQDKAIKSLVKFDLIDYELGTHNGRSCRLFRIKERIGILRKIFGGIDITVLEDARVKKLDTNNTNISSEKLDGTGQETEPDGSRNLTRQVKKLDTNNTKVTILKKNTKEGEGEPPSDDFFLACKEAITKIANKISGNISFKVQATDKDANKLYEYLKDNGGDEETLLYLVEGLRHLNDYWTTRIKSIDHIYKGEAIIEIAALGKKKMNVLDKMDIEEKKKEQGGRLNLGKVDKSYMPWDSKEDREEKRRKWKEKVDEAIAEITAAAGKKNEENNKSLDFFLRYELKEKHTIFDQLDKTVDLESLDHWKSEIIEKINKYEFKEPGYYKNKIIEGITAAAEKRETTFDQILKESTYTMEDLDNGKEETDFLKIMNELWRLLLNWNPY